MRWSPSSPVHSMYSSPCSSLLRLQQLQLSLLTKGNFPSPPFGSAFHESPLQTTVHAARPCSVGDGAIFYLWHALTGGREVVHGDASGRVIWALLMALQVSSCGLLGVYSFGGHLFLVTVCFNSVHCGCFQTLRQPSH